MNYDKLNTITRQFLLGESSQPSVHSFIQALGETITKFKPKTQTEQRRVEMAKNQLKEIKRRVRRLEEQVNVLQEQLKILEESAQMTVTEDNDK
tara:strand:+ start:355 stop:636 length:282 start_codon:yes stop_codon:yes gene_type:complete